ncbi:transmembrane protein, putative [Medicago truncatula]|uniref:Transmembrane protein, putative n=1 Tax=Medicago truncatula TaxID=3880 RepID=G7IH04_MEDTR|nr:transmembrane protein, putative [Medicago truncatula]
MATTMHVRDVIQYVEETSSISVETLHVQSVQVEDTLAIAEIHNGDQQSNSFSDMRITGPWCDAVTDMDYGNDHTLDNFEQKLGTNNHVVVADSNLSNFSANVIHDMQVLGLVPYVAQQTMDFLSDSWTNIGQKEEIADLTRNTGQPFQLVLSRKKKSKKQQSDASKCFKVGASSHSSRYLFSRSLILFFGFIFFFFFSCIRF